MTQIQERPVKTHPHQKEWDHHGSYQWTYFHESVKQKIGFFLSRRLRGKNLDLGGGWYLTHPGSTVVDLSPVCLEYNPAKEKVLFDLETLADGAHLPFNPHSFDSATMVSVWQYIKNSDALVAELRRVLKPGAELYLINGQGAGLSGCLRNASRSAPIAKYFHDKGFDTLVEDIPCSVLEPNEFQSVCVAMPSRNLFGEEISQVQGKSQRMAENQERGNHPRPFLEEFARYQVSLEVAGLSGLATHPVTKASRDFLARVSEFSSEYKQRSGNPVLVFAEHTIEPALNMMIPGEDRRDSLFFATCFAFGQRDYKLIEELMGKYGLWAINHMNYLEGASPEEVLEECRKLKTAQQYQRESTQSSLMKLTQFAAVPPLNEDARALQEGVRIILDRDFGEEFQTVLGKQIALGLHLYAGEHKQRRKTDKLLERKRYILESGVPVVGEASLDFSRYVPYLSKFHFNEESERRGFVDWSDD
jgi:hypothetical protein